jgi:hypothetical protein
MVAIPVVAEFRILNLNLISEYCPSKTVEKALLPTLPPFQLKRWLHSSEVLPFLARGQEAVDMLKRTLASQNVRRLEEEPAASSQDASLVDNL